MSARFHRIRRTTHALSACVLLAAAIAQPVAAQEPDLCSVLSQEDLSASIPDSNLAPLGMAGTCQWMGTTSSGVGVIVIAYLVPGSVTDMPGAETIDIGGHPAFSAEDPAAAAPTHVVGVETDGELLVLSVTAEDATIDLPAVTTALASAAIGRLESSDLLTSTSPEPTGAVPSVGVLPPTASASTTPVGTGSVCDLATPEEIAAAAGIDVELNVQDLEIACSWDAVSDDGYVLVYAARQEPVAFDAILASLGAEEVEGPGEQDWWASSLASLFSRQGDLLLQVSYTSSVALDEDELKATTMAIMEVLLGS
jgi:hypothetical protein